MTQVMDPTYEYSKSLTRLPISRVDGSPIEVLVVDDEPAINGLISLMLRYEGWNVTVANTGADALRAVSEERIDVVVLEVMLPDMSGLDVLERMHELRPALPILLLSAKDTTADRIAGLAAGGDDYVTKPFSVEEVILRLRSVVRRSGAGTIVDNSRLIVGDLLLDEDSHEVTRAGTQIPLTATEYAVLRYMMHNPRRVLTKAQILDSVWKCDFGGRPNVVELHISHLRKKIDTGRTPMINTIRGVGYLLKPA